MTEDPGPLAPCPYCGSHIARESIDCPKCGREFSDDEFPPRGFAALAGLFGIRTRRINGHEIGCPCQDCRAMAHQDGHEMRERLKRGEKTGTLGELLGELLDEKNARRETKDNK